MQHADTRSTAKSNSKKNNMAERIKTNKSRVWCKVVWSMSGIHKSVARAGGDPARYTRGSLATYAGPTKHTVAIRSGRHTFSCTDLLTVGCEWHKPCKLCDLQVTDNVPQWETIGGTMRDAS